MCCRERVFSVQNRRHHCRQCGDVICRNCAVKAKPPWHTPTEKSELVCKTCTKVWATEDKSKGVYTSKGFADKSELLERELQEDDFEELNAYYWFYAGWTRVDAEAALEVRRSLRSLACTVDPLSAVQPGTHCTRPLSHHPPRVCGVVIFVCVSWHNARLLLGDQPCVSVLRLTSVCCGCSGRVCSQGILCAARAATLTASLSPSLLWPSPRATPTSSTF